MAESLGIIVATDKYLDHIVGLTKAARDAGKEVRVFFTAAGVKLVPDEKAQELVKAGANVTICDKTYTLFELDKAHGKDFEGMTFGSQDDNAENIDLVDRLVVF
jgi:peroxiredoxin family protein